MAWLGSSRAWLDKIALDRVLSKPFGVSNGRSRDAVMVVVGDEKAACTAKGSMSKVFS